LNYTKTAKQWFGHLTRARPFDSDSDLTRLTRQTLKRFHQLSFLYSCVLWQPCHKRCGFSYQGKRILIRQDNFFTVPFVAAHNTARGNTCHDNEVWIPSIYLTSYGKKFLKMTSSVDHHRLYLASYWVRFLYIDECLSS
jgi:hypothetical protein